MRNNEQTLMKKEAFEFPKATVIVFEEDVIVTSGDSNNYGKWDPVLNGSRIEV